MNNKKKRVKKPFVPQFTKEEIKEMASSSGYKVGYMKGYLNALRNVRCSELKDEIWFIHLGDAMRKRAKKLGL